MTKVSVPVSSSYYINNQGVSAPLACDPKPQVCEPKPEVCEEARAKSARPVDNQTSTYTSHEVPAKALSFTKRSSETNNAQRTTANSKPDVYADARVTRDGTAYAGAAMLKGRDESSGIEVEAFTGSVQVGLQNEAQVGMTRLGISSKDGSNSATMDIFTAQANAGFYNKDGSTGLNGGAMAVAVGVEGTASTGATGVTGGLSISAGVEGSVGVRDQDGDGYGEACLRVGLMFFTVGIQIEDPRGWGIWNW